MKNFKGALASAQSNFGGVVRNEEGERWYPATQRSDGTWRKPIKIREDYNPVTAEKYVIKQRRIGISEGPFENLPGCSHSSEFQPDSKEITSQMEALNIRGNGGFKKESEDTVDRGASSTLQPALPKLDRFLHHLVPPSEPTKSAPKDSSKDQMKSHKDLNLKKEDEAPSSILKVSQWINGVAGSYGESVRPGCDAISSQPIKVEKDYQCLETGLTGQRNFVPTTETAGHRDDSDKSLDPDYDKELEELKLKITSGALTQQEIVTAWNSLVAVRYWEQQSGTIG